MNTAFTSSTSRRATAAVAAFAGAAILATSAAFAQEAPVLATPAQQTNRTLALNLTSPASLRDLTDAQFVSIVAQTSNDESTGARFVVSRTKNPLIRAFGEQVIDNQGLAAVSLRVAARQTAPDLEASASVVPVNIAATNLGSATGTTLDNRFIANEINQQRLLTDVLRAESAYAKTVSLRVYAATELPAAQAQLGRAQAYAVSNGANFGDSPTVGNLVTGGYPTTGSLMNGIPLSNGSSETGGPSPTTGAGISGSNTGQAPFALPTPVAQAQR